MFCIFVLSIKANKRNGNVMKLTFKIHLAKQIKGTENRNVAECGKKANRYGALRTAKMNEFLSYDIEHQCSVCLGKLKK